MKRGLVVLLIMASAMTAVAQEKVLQVSGVVLVGDSLFPGSYVSVIRSHDGRGTYADRDGFFTMPVLAGDTLRFLCIGLKDSYFVIPSSVTEDRLSLVQVMESDPLTLPTVYILPYPSPQNLRREIMSLDLPGDNYLAFSRDISSIKDYDGMADFSDRSYREAAATLGQRYSNGFQSGGNVLNAAAWNKFIRAIRSGDTPPLR